MKYTTVQPYPCDYSEFEQCYFNTGSAVIIDPATGAQATDPATGIPLVVDPETGGAIPDPAQVSAPSSPLISNTMLLLYGLAAIIGYKFLYR